MVVALFALIAWIVLIIFVLIPKALSINENIIMFFLITIIVVSIDSVIDLNLKLIQHSYKTEKFISMWIDRNLIMTSCLMIFVNFLAYSHMKISKITISVVTLMILYFFELLTVLTGVSFYTGWNGYLSIITFSLQMIISNFLMKWTRNIQ